MSKMLMPAVMWITGGIVQWLAGRYHLTPEQQSMATSDIVGWTMYAGCAATGLFMHWRHMMAPPPTGGQNGKSS